MSVSDGRGKHEGMTFVLWADKRRKMTQKLLRIDIEPKSSSHTESRTGYWTRSDNSFRFNFSENFTEIHNNASPSPDRTEPTTSQLPFTGQGSAFAFNFQIYPEENMDILDTSSRNQQCTEVRNPSLEQISSPQEASASSKSKKKKKKSAKNKPSDNTQPPEQISTVELSAEEQLQRQLDWCIDQLEVGMRSQKATSKQKEEASRAIKTLQSSKAPLAKKRQVMRAMVGDYRKKMEEEQSKQLKLIQNEAASAQVRAVSEFPKKSVFYRRAGIKDQTPESQTNSNSSQPAAAATQHEMPFVYTPSKEEFHFNFL